MMSDRSEDDRQQDSLPHELCRRRERPARLLPRRDGRRRVDVDRQVHVHRRQPEVRRAAPHLLLAHRGSGDAAAGRASAGAPCARRRRHRRRHRDRVDGRHPVARHGPRILERVHRRPAERAVRLPQRVRVERRARPPGVRHRNRPLRRADRQAGPVRGGVRRPQSHPLSSRRLGVRRSGHLRAGACCAQLEASTLVFYTGRARKASTILAEQSAAISPPTGP